VEWVDRLKGDGRALPPPSAMWAENTIITERRPSPQRDSLVCDLEHGRKSLEYIGVNTVNTIYVQLTREMV
jgi:hypothetical protein